MYYNDRTKNSKTHQVTNQCANNITLIQDKQSNWQTNKVILCSIKTYLLMIQWFSWKLTYTINILLNSLIFLRPVLLSRLVQSILTNSRPFSDQLVVTADNQRTGPTSHWSAELTNLIRHGWKITGLQDNLRQSFRIVRDTQKLSPTLTLEKEDHLVKYLNLRPNGNALKRCVV